MTSQDDEEDQAVLQSLRALVVAELMLIAPTYDVERAAEQVRRAVRAQRLSNELL